MKRIFLIFPLLFTSCADTWSEKATEPAQKTTEEVAKPAETETPPPPPMPEEAGIRFVTPNTTGELVGDQEKRSVNPSLSTNEAAEPASNTVQANPPAATPPPLPTNDGTEAKIPDGNN